MHPESPLPHHQPTQRTQSGRAERMDSAARTAIGAGRRNCVIVYDNLAPLKRQSERAVRCLARGMTFSSDPAASFEVMMEGADFVPAEEA